MQVYALVQLDGMSNDSVVDSSIHDVGHLSEFQEAKGRQIELQGRMISVFRHHGKLYALDLNCYHMGGPLAAGDIEELLVERAPGNQLEVHPCVVCPWHKYKISLTTGEGIYHQVDPFSSKQECDTKSRGRKQRTRIVFEEHERVMVQLNLSNEGKLESDHYASEDFKFLMQRRRTR